MRVLVTGSYGQLGSELKKHFNGVFVDKDDLDITSTEAVKAFEVSGIDAIINAAAFTNVDACELEENKPIVKAVNVEGVKNLATLAKSLDVPLVHISTDYVFDGSKDGAYLEGDLPKPISEYGRSKLSSEKAMATSPKHYLIRTSWVIGQGHNFVRTMLSLAEKGINPGVVDDQIGRLTFTPILAGAIKHLLESKAEYGIYNVTNSGQPASWAEIARKVYDLAGKDAVVKNVSTEEYYKGKTNIAPRPKNSVLDLSKIERAGYSPPDWQNSLENYLKDFQ